jgi:hypothetical protein
MSQVASRIWIRGRYEVHLVYAYDGIQVAVFGRCEYNYYLIQIRGYHLFVLATACYLA